MKTVAVASLTATVVYIFICAYFYFIQESIIFHPQHLPDDFKFTYNFEFEERYFDVANEAKIHSIHAKTADSLQGLVLFFHGNAGSNQTASDKFEIFLNLGFDVLHPDYHSYGKSTGNLKNESQLIDDMNSIYLKMAEEYGEENIFLIGYSLGSGVAALIAAENDPKGLMLWAPFFSILDVKNSAYPFLPDFLVKYPLRVDEALKKIEEPVYLFFAENDRVLPLEDSYKLTEILKEKDQYFVLQGQGHMGIFQHPDVIKRLPEILEVE